MFTSQTCEPLLLKPKLNSIGIEHVVQLMERDSGKCLIPQTSELKMGIFVPDIRYGFQIAKVIDSFATGTVLNHPKYPAFLA